MIDWWINLDRRWKIRIFGLAFLLPQVFFYIQGAFFPKLAFLGIGLIGASFIIPGDSSSTDL